MRWILVAAVLGLPSCREPDEAVTIAAVGDLLLQAPLQQQAFAVEGGYVSLWGDVVDLVTEADVAYANLEGPMARGVDASGHDVPDPGKTFDRVVYTGFPRFNYHPSLADDLVASGFDVVSTANNHSLDRRALGIDRTLEALDAAGLAHAGTRHADGSGSWHAITDAGGLRIGWIACTYGTNGILDEAAQVLHCYEDEAAVLEAISTLRAEVDAVFVTPHWGVQYTEAPTDQDVALGRAFLDAGAVAVLGSHPHVLQPWERHVTPDGREGFVAYSLGNFVSDQTTLPRRTTIILELELKRHVGEVVVAAVRYVPLAMDRTGGLRLARIDCEPGFEDERAHVVALYGEEALVGCP